MNRWRDSNNRLRSSNRDQRLILLLRLRLMNRAIWHNLVLVIKMFCLIYRCMSHSLQKKVVLIRKRINWKMLLGIMHLYL